MIKRISFPRRFLMRINHNLDNYFEIQYRTKEFFNLPESSITWVSGGGVVIQWSIFPCINRITSPPRTNPGFLTRATPLDIGTRLQTCWRNDALTRPRSLVDIYAC